MVYNIEYMRPTLRPDARTLPLGYNTGLSMQTLKSGADLIMSAVGYAGLPGVIISGVYFITDVATDGFGLNKQ